MNFVDERAAEKFEYLSKPSNGCTILPYYYIDVNSIGSLKLDDVLARFTNMKCFLHCDEPYSRGVIWEFYANLRVLCDGCLITKVRGQSVFITNRLIDHCFGYERCAFYTQEKYQKIHDLTMAFKADYFSREKLDVIPTLVFDIVRKVLWPIPGMDEEPSVWQILLFYCILSNGESYFADSLIQTFVSYAETPRPRQLPFANFIMKIVRAHGVTGPHPHPPVRCLKVDKDLIPDKFFFDRVTRSWSKMSPRLILQRELTGIINRFPLVSKKKFQQCDEAGGSGYCSDVDLSA